MRKPAFCICENKDADQLRGSREADQRLCFRYIDSTIPLVSNPKFQASSHLLWLYSLICVGPDKKPECWFSHDAAHISLFLCVTRRGGLSSTTWSATCWEKKCISIHCFLKMQAEILFFFFKKGQLLSGGIIEGQQCGHLMLYDVTTSNFTVHGTCTCTSR